MDIHLPPELQTRSGGRWRRLLWLAALSLLLVLALVFWPGRSPDSDSRFVTEAVTRADLVVSISANGTLQPTRAVDVGSELSGTLAEVLVDENDRVRAGQVLARLDTERLEDALAQAQAALQQAEATQEEMRTQLQRLQRLAQLSDHTFPAAADLDSARAAFKRAQANRQAAAASLRSARTNLARAQIRSPINGYVLSRRVEPGQTVAATMNTPVLFTLAEDLTRMELEIRVDEADVSAVQLGQEASFTVSAWPGRQFAAALQRIGMGSTLTDNVVTYRTILAVRNDDLALRPGMTATARIITARRPQALLVPNAALRFTPPVASTAPSGGLVARLVPRAPHTSKQRPVTRRGQTQVWVLQDGLPVAVEVQTGASDGRLTEIVKGQLQAGMPVIVEYQEPRP